MHHLPSITLDTTLAELYGKGSGADSLGRIALVLSAANSETRLNASIPRNKKFLYEDSTFSNTPKNLSPTEYAALQRHTAVKYLSLVPQHDAFASGSMPVILFDLDNSEAKADLSLNEAKETMSSLEPAQRPHLLFFHGPSDISLEANGIDVLAVKMALDGLERFPLTVSLETTYFLNSKGALCTSGLPTPKCDLIQLEGICPDAQSCCSTCSANAESLSILAGCTGARGTWLSSRISRAISRISSKPLPFVFKNQQTFGGGGTFVVTTSDDCENLIHDLSTRLLPKLYTQVTPANAHLKPATLLLSEFVADPVGDFGLTFFVTRTGECIFLAVTEQTVDSSKAWIGSKVSYTAQDALERKFKNTMLEIGAWLHGYGYYGPVGADILETAATGDRGSGTFYITDLNVRTSGSLSLGLLQGHFSKRRGLHEASSFSVNLKMGRKEFISKLSSQFEEGRVIIVAWYNDVKSQVSFANIIVGAEDRERLEEEIKRVKRHGTEIHF